MRGVTILYDQATEGTMAPIAIAVSDTFEGFPDPNAAPPPGRERERRIRQRDRGERAAAISSRRAKSPTNCQSITVPGFGHADRIAEDKTNDLALLRLYGARNLVAGAARRRRRHGRPR